MQPAPTDEERAGEPASVGLVDAAPSTIAAACPVAHAPAEVAGGCPVDHETGLVAAPASGGCPVGHGAASSPAPPPSAGGCPVAHSADGVRRSPADMVVRKVLRIRERPTGAAAGSAYGSFQRSMLISAVRCTLTYVVFPFVAPAVGVATGVGPVLGIVIGSFAIVCDVFTIRRFFAVDHKWRWPVSAIAFSVICLLAVLLVQDVSHLLR